MVKKLINERNYLIFSAVLVAVIYVTCYYNSFYLLNKGNTFNIVENKELCLYISKDNFQYNLHIYADLKKIESILIEIGKETKSITEEKTIVNIDPNKILKEADLKIYIKDMSGHITNINIAHFRKFNGKWVINKPKYLNDNMEILRKLKSADYNVKRETIDVTDEIAANYLDIVKNCKTDEEAVNNIYDWIINNLFVDKTTESDDKSMYYTKKGNITDFCRYMSVYLNIAGIPNTTIKSNSNYYCLYLIEKKWMVMCFNEEYMNTYENGRYILNFLPNAFNYGLSIEFVSQSECLNIENIII